MTTQELRRVFKADRRGEATCPICHDARLYINPSEKMPGKTVMNCLNCGMPATLAILATKGLRFKDLYETDDPRYRRVMALKETP